MYDYSLTESFIKDFKKLDSSLQKIIFKKINYLVQEQITRKHLKYGLPYFVLKINISSRLVYVIKENSLIFVKVFKNQKDYENWFSSL